MKIRSFRSNILFTFSAPTSFNGYLSCHCFLNRQTSVFLGTPKLQDFRRLHSSVTAPFPPALSGASSIAYEISASDNMILRVRSNLGTWKLNTNDSHLTSLAEQEQEPSIRTVLDWMEAKHGIHSDMIATSLSKDAKGMDKLNSMQSLHEQGLSHGSMIYCRILDDAKTQTPVSTTVNANSQASPASAEKICKTAVEVIDLLDSDSENENDQETDDGREDDGGDENQDILRAIRNSLEDMKPSSTSFDSTSSSDDDDNHSINLLASSSESEAEDDQNVVVATKAITTKHQRGSIKRPPNSQQSSGSIRIITQNENASGRGTRNLSEIGQKRKQRTTSTTMMSKTGDQASPPPGKKTVSKSASPRTKKNTGDVVQSASVTLMGDDDGREQLSLASYNVWFGPPDPTANGVHPEARMKAILQHLHADNVSFQNEASARGKRLHDCIGFQEVTAELAQFLIPRLKALGYHVVLQPGVASAYGCAMAVPRSTMQKMKQAQDTSIATSTPSSVQTTAFVPYSNSCMGRGILYVRTDTHLFCTTHLESFCSQDANGSKEREVQLREIEKFCKRQFELFPTLHTAVCMGDLNWDDERVRSKGENKPLLEVFEDGSTWRDTWLEWQQKQFNEEEKKKSGTRKTKSAKKIPIGGFTYDSRLNPMMSNGGMRRRFDRCLIFTRASTKVQNFQLVGQSALFDEETNRPLGYRKFNSWNQTYKAVPAAASDHFGLVISLLQATK